MPYRLRGLVRTGSAYVADINASLPKRITRQWVPRQACRWRGVPWRFVHDWNKFFVFPLSEGDTGPQQLHPRRRAAPAKNDKENAMANDADTLRKDIEELRQSVDKLTKDVSSLSKSLADQWKADAAGAARQVRKSAAAVADDITARGRESTEAMERAVKDHPFQGLVLAFGLGLLLAQILGRR